MKAEIECLKRFMQAPKLATNLSFAEAMSLQGEEKATSSTGFLPGRLYDGRLTLCLNAHSLNQWIELFFLRRGMSGAHFDIDILIGDSTRAMAGVVAHMFAWSVFDIFGNPGVS
ncbi:MAG: hypothetical protein RLZZ225_1126 [Pseudomonadota bacterium]